MCRHNCVLAALLSAAVMAVLVIELRVFSLFLLEWPFYLAVLLTGLGGFVLAFRAVCSGCACACALRRMPAILALGALVAFLSGAAGLFLLPFSLLLSYLILFFAAFSAGFVVVYSFCFLLRLQHEKAH